MQPLVSSVKMDSRSNSLEYKAHWQNKEKPGLNKVEVKKQLYKNCSLNSRHGEGGGREGGREVVGKRKNGGSRGTG